MLIVTLPYLIVEERKPWDDASLYCESMNSYLIEISTDTECDFVEKLMRDYIGSLVSFWIGATDRDIDGRFVYQMSRQLVPEKFWRPGQPNNDGRGAQCVAIGQWKLDQYLLDLYDTFCYNKKSVVCEKTEPSL